VNQHGQDFVLLCIKLGVVVSQQRERDQAYQSLEQRVIERTQEIDRRRQIAESLRDVLRTINSQRLLADVLTYITQQATIVLGADAVVTCQYDEAEGKCLLQAHHGLEHLHLVNAADPPGWELIKSRIDEVAPIALHGGEVTTKHGVGSAYQPQFQALLAVPLSIRDAAYGYLILYYLDPRSFDEEAISLAVTFADQMALALENAHLRHEAGQLAAYEERNRLARDLHDTVTQTLWSANLLADVIPTLWQRDPTRAAQRLEQLRQLNRVALQEMRALLLGLRPKALTETGLADLLRQLIAMTAAQAQFRIDFAVFGETRKIPTEVQVAYYRVAQEALNNIIRHAEATHVMVQLDCDENTRYTVTMTIRDDGRGFDASTITSGHFGAKIMHERAASISAQLTVSSKLGAGTLIEMKWLAAEA